MNSSVSSNQPGGSRQTPTPSASDPATAPASTQAPAPTPCPASPARTSLPPKNPIPRASSSISARHSSCDRRPPSAKNSEHRPRTAEARTKTSDHRPAKSKEGQPCLPRGLAAQYATLGGPTYSVKLDPVTEEVLSASNKRGKTKSKSSIVLKAKSRLTRRKRTPTPKPQPKPKNPKGRTTLVVKKVKRPRPSIHSASKKRKRPSKGSVIMNRGARKVRKRGVICPPKALKMAAHAAEKAEIAAVVATQAAEAAAAGAAAAMAVCNANGIQPFVAQELYITNAEGTVYVERSPEERGADEPHCEYHQYEYP